MGRDFRSQIPSPFFGAVTYDATTTATLAYFGEAKNYKNLQIDEIAINNRHASNTLVGLFGFERDGIQYIFGTTGTVAAGSVASYKHSFVLSGRIRFFVSVTGSGTGTTTRAFIVGKYLD